ncbi:Clp protease [Streptococcus phage P9854]|uniref:Clp protease n=2 Tax=Moineauvirus TaxID=1623304 RepID=A0A286QT29_9CAUD|nr:Clp protease [Streptococcus phage P9851]YP_010647520.1 Clp protease [Streptococcus phage P9854]ARU14514.1 Clp protease [Streptococcus phage P9851]ARU14652.1 Clp protease [Streptococcus phage P9854]
MGKIDIKGDIASDDLVAFYDFFGMKCTYPKMVQEAIENDKDEEITLNIASNGGDVFAASEIYTMLRDSGKRIVVNVQGLAASAASVISMAGDTVRISPTAQIMIHKASTGIRGNSDDMEHQSVVLNSIDESIALAYEMKTGLKQTELLDLMAKETWLNAKTAVDKGFADEIMFSDTEEEVMVTNATHQLPSKSAINKFKNMIAKPKTNSLREQKLAVLLEK